MVARIQSAYGRRGGRRTPVLPHGAGDFFKRRALELGGAAVLAAGTALALAIVSFDPGDPSFSHAARGPVANWLSRPGALVADLTLQTLGLTALILPLALIVWGFKLLGKDAPPRLGLRVAAIPPAILLLAVAGAAASAPPAWPIAAGFGGLIGKLLLARVNSLAGPTSDWFAVSAAATGSGLLIYALGIPFRRWRGAARAVLGWLGQGWRVVGRSGGAALFALARQAPRLSAALAGAWRRAKISAGRAGDRREPRFAGKDAAEDPPAPPTDRGGDEQSIPIVITTHEVPEAKPKKPARQLALPLSEGSYQLPPLDLLTSPDPDVSRIARADRESLMQNAQLLMTVLDDFGIRGRISQVRPGPVVTLYELEPAPGTKSSRIIGLADDIARSMSAASARIAVVPGRNAIGIELPNARREFVHLRELLATARSDRTSGALLLALGKDISGEPVHADLSRMPHLLIAGTTGSGKSVGVNAMVLSLLYRLTPAECKFIMIDPKVLELSVYDGIPHLLAPVVTDPKKSVVALKWVVREMENRYRAMSKLNVRNITGYNQRLEQARKRSEVITRRVQTGFDPETGRPIVEEQALDLTPLPTIVVIVDEMADLMLVAGKDVEAAIQRLSQMARAAGIHLIMATQRPSVDVVTGTIKANFPTRISFQVTSKIDSRTILGEQGAEQLLGMGDMLYMQGGGRITRVHGPFVSDREVEAVVAYLKDQGAPDYLEEITEDELAEDGDPLATLAGEDNGASLYDQAVALVARERRASTSFIQRHLQIGYNRAARIIEQMEKEGVVSQANHVGKREVLVMDHAGRGRE